MPRASKPLTLLPISVGLRNNSNAATGSASSDAPIAGGIPRCSAHSAVRRLSAGFSREALSCSGICERGDLAIMEHSAPIGIARSDAHEDVVDDDRLGVHIDAVGLRQRDRSTRCVRRESSLPTTARRHSIAGPGSASRDP